MFLKSRYFLISGLLGLLLSVILFSYYRVPSLPLDGVLQRRAAKKMSPQDQIMQYYREYPGRYIRISKETWQYLEGSRKALHSFTLQNMAMVPYHAIEVSFTYQSAGGKTLQQQTVKIPGAVAAGGSTQVKDFEVKNVPGAARSVLIVVEKAVIGQ